MTAITFVEAQVLRPDGSFGRTLRVERGVVSGVDVSPRRGDLVVSCDEAVVLPGLINAHDHLELNSFGRLKWRDAYRNVSEWIADFQPRFATDPALADARPETLGDRLLVGALKNLLAGVTTVCHHNPIYAPLRWRFPIRIVRRFGFSHSIGVDGAGVQRAFRATPRAWPWIIHAAEGVDQEAASEMTRLEGWGCVGPNTTFVHGVGLRADDRRRLIESGGSLVWCPGSNGFLFGATADVLPFSRVGRLALGTDSRMSGEADLLEEMRAARRTGKVDAAELVRTVTSGGAAVLRLPRAGRLAPGAQADVTIIASRGVDPISAVIGARRTDVRLTMIGGRAVVADQGLSELFADAGRGLASIWRRPAVPIRVDGEVRLMSASLATRVARLRVREPGVEVPA